MKISASIVTYNSEDEIEIVLNSLMNSKTDNLEVTVVDNASTDNTCSIVETKFKNVRLIKSATNLGFGAGHNLALKGVESDYHIFVNPDISVEENQIKAMVDYMEANPGVVVLTPKVLNEDGTEQFLPKKYPKIKYLLGGKFENKGKIFYKWRSEYTLRDVEVVEPIHIDFCTGCFMFCRTDALLSVGGFDERYFLHFEDADLTREMQKLGETMYVPSVYVTHKWHRDNAGNKKIRKIAIQSMFKYFKKWR